MAEIVLVHGAFHGPWCFDPVVAAVRAEGAVVSAVELPFTGFADDAAAARAAIVTAGPGAVVCAHSYGGVVADQALAGLTGVHHVVYLAAFINAGLAAPRDEPMPILEALQRDGDLTRVDPARAHDIFYGDSDAEVAATMTAQLRPMVLEASAFAGDPPPRPAAGSTYVVCTQDRALVPPAQQRLAGLCDRSVSWPTDHSPFLTRPRAVAELLLDALP